MVRTSLCSRGLVPHGKRLKRLQQPDFRSNGATRQSNHVDIRAMQQPTSPQKVNVGTAAARVTARHTQQSFFNPQTPPQLTAPANVQSPKQETNTNNNKQQQPPASQFTTMPTSTTQPSKAAAAAAPADIESGTRAAQYAGPQQRGAGMELPAPWYAAAYNSALPTPHAPSAPEQPNYNTSTTYPQASIQMPQVHVPTLVTVPYRSVATPAHARDLV